MCVCGAASGVAADEATAHAPPPPPFFPSPLPSAAAAFGVAGAAAPHALAEPLTTTDREHLARVAALLDGLKAALPAEGGAAAQAGGAAAAAADDDAPAKAAAFVETLVKTCWCAGRC